MGAAQVDPCYERIAVCEAVRRGRVVRERVDHVLGQLDHTQTRVLIERGLHTPNGANTREIVGRDGDGPRGGASSITQLAGEQLEGKEGRPGLALLDQVDEARDQIVRRAAPRRQRPTPVRARGQTAFPGHV